MKKILLMFMIVVVSFSCIDNNVKTDSRIIKSKELQSMVMYQIRSY